MRRVPGPGNGPIVYHVAAPTPPVPGTDAVFQEAAALRTRFGGAIFTLYPFRHGAVAMPRELYGMHRLLAARRREAGTRAHHVLSAYPYPYPFLRWLRRPVVYTVTAGLDPTRPLANGSLHRVVDALVVASERERVRLEERGLGHVHVVRPGIDLNRFPMTPTPDRREFTVLMASAPWTVQQLRTKGVEALLATAPLVPRLRLIFLCRGLLAEVIQARVRVAGLEDRVEVLDGYTDMRRLLARVHAVAVLVDDPTLVRAYPHSLLEALAAGRPVLVSACIPLADEIGSREAGAVVRHLSAPEIARAVAALIDRYDAAGDAARRLGQEFPLEGMLRAYATIYASFGQPG